MGGPELNWTNEVVRLQRIIEFARSLRHVPMQKSAHKVWARMYPEIEKNAESLPTLTAKICARASAHVRRLALLFALLDECDCIETRHLHAARQLWDYCQESARFIFEQTTAEQDRMLGFIRQNVGVTASDLRENLFKRNRRAEWIQTQLDYLVGHGKIVRTGDGYSLK